MRKTLVPIAASILLSTLGATAAQADPPPPIKADPISIDRTSQSIAVCRRNASDLYGEVPIGGIVGQGCDVSTVGPVLHVAALTYGLNPRRDNNDGHSNGEVDLDAKFVIYFSGDRASVGVAGTDYATQAALKQAAGDRFVTNGPTSVSLAAAMAACSAGTILGPVLPGPINLLSVNQTRYNLIPSISPSTPYNGKLDEVDALELTLFDLNGDNVHDTPVYFTVDRTSVSWSGASDILYSPPASSSFTVFSLGGQLGLTDADNVDALAVWDLEGNGVADPGDFAIFSLDRTSPTLAAAGFSAADIFVTDFGGGFCPFLLATSIGLLSTDNVDGVDVETWVGPESIEIWEERVQPGPDGVGPAR